MKRALFLLTLLAISATIIGQSYLGKISKQVNFREGPAVDYKLVKTLKAGTTVFIVSSVLENDFYNIIDIESNKEGYVHKSYVIIGKELPKNNEGIFSPNGAASSYNAEIEVYNNTSKTLTLRLNKEVFLFRPKERKTLSISPGNYDYIASAPSVIPDYGNESVTSNSAYTWEFYIVTRRN